MAESALTCCSVWTSGHLMANLPRPTSGACLPAMLTRSDCNCRLRVCTTIERLQSSQVRRGSRCMQRDRHHIVNEDSTRA